MLRLAIAIALLPLIVEAQEIGEPAPDVACGNWLNVAEGEAPSLASLKGKLVLLEFWFST